MICYDGKFANDPTWDKKIQKAEEGFLFFLCYLSIITFFAFCIFNNELRKNN